MRDLPEFAVEDGEVPAVGALPPLAVVLAAGLAVEPDVARDVAARLLRALLPRAHVIEHPVAVLLLAGEHVGVQPEDGRGEVERVVADAVQVLVAVRQHLLVIGLQVEHLAAAGGIVQQVEGAGNRVAHPVVGGRLAQHRTLAAGPDAPDDLVYGVVVGRLRILAHVHGREASRCAAGRVRRSDRTSPSRRNARIPSAVWNQSDWVMNSLL